MSRRALHSRRDFVGALAAVAGGGWLALGARYTPDPKWWVDVGAAYIWVNSGSIDEIGSSNFGQPPSAASSGRVLGSYDNNVFVLSAQVTFAF